MSRRLYPALLCAAAMYLSACGTARVVSRTQYSGELALEGDRHKALEDALEIIRSHCQGPYQIIEEGEVVVGTDTVHTDESHVTEDGRVVNHARTRTREDTEWRLRYECGSAQPAPPNTGAPGAAPAAAPGAAPAATPDRTHTP